MFRCPDAENPRGGTPVQEVNIPERVREEFQEFEIPPSEINSSPVGWGVSKKRTAFWADSAVREFDMSLLGVAIRVRATPVEYRWDFGDGTKENTTAPGSEPAEGAEPEFFHVYQSSGVYTVGLSTVYTGEFSVNGGGWMPIEGQASIASTPVEMTIYRYHRYVVDEDCTVNPSGPDCG